MLLFELDKAGAEWVVVAYLTADKNMLDVVKSGKSPHVVTGSLISRVPEYLVERENKIVDKATDPMIVADLRQQLPELLEGGFFLPRSMSIRQMGKKSNHGLNYDERYKTFALINEMDEKDSRIIVDLYKKQAYPGIPDWYQAIQGELRADRTLTNCFGRRRKFYEAWGDQLFKQAYAFKPQSTVVDMVNEGLVKSYYDTTDYMEPAETLSQVHDSLVGQYPMDYTNMAKAMIKIGLDYLSPVISYGEEFKIGTDLKIGFDWGDMVEVKLVDNVSELADRIDIGVKRLIEMGVNPSVPGGSIAKLGSAHIG